MMSLAAEVGKNREVAQLVSSTSRLMGKHHIEMDQDARGWPAMSIYQGSFDKQIPGLRFIDRSAEGFLDIVYDNGFDPAVPLYDCGPYVLTITKDGALFDTVSVSNHFDQSCWWYELAPVDGNSIVRQPAELIANGYVPPIGKTAIPLSAPSLGKDKFPGIMKLTPDVTGGEASTGGRPEIGIVTTNVAEWLMLGDARDMMEDAKDLQTQPIWNYDNGRPIDLIAKPKTTHYSNTNQGGAPNWIGPYPAKPTATGAVLQPSTPDTAHMADLCGVVALATGAPRYVRALQMRVIRGFDEDAYWALKWGQVTVWKRQSRGTAWLLRELFFCYWATKLAEDAGNRPNDCLPASHFKTIIDNQAALFAKYIEPSAIFQNFGIIQDQAGIIAWWQVDMINQVLGLYAQKWPADWGQIYIKVLRNLAARTNADGLNQWPTAMPTWYWGAIGPYVNGSYGGKPYSGYAELLQTWYASQIAGVDIAGRKDFLYLNAAEVAALKADPANGGKFMKPSQYQSWTYGALAFAVYLDRAGPLKGAISAAYPNLEQAFADHTAKMLNNYPYFIAPCSFSITPLPSPTSPPPTPSTGNITMTAVPALNGPFTATVHFLDDADVERPVDSIDWSSTGGIAWNPPTSGATVTGVYAGTGPFEITAVGHVGGHDIMAKIGGTVPVPFPTHGRIDLS